MCHHPQVYLPVWNVIAGLGFSIFKKLKKLKFSQTSLDFSDFGRRLANFRPPGKGCADLGWAEF